jgi:ribosomal protein S18 acetylase RimI-like enzyme
LLADLNGKVVGLISYTLRPNLYHSALCGVIEELVVSEASRGQGIGHALIAEVITRLQALECAEISVSTLMENRDAQRFYRSHGLVDEAILLERHF